MISRYDACLNGVALSSLHPDLYVSDILYNPAEIQDQQYTLANRNGAYLTTRKVNAASVTIQFALRVYNTQERNRMCQEIAAWAMRGGVLETSDRPDQRLRCRCSAPPAVTSAKRWTDNTLSATFTAYAMPFWEEKIPSSITLTGSDVSGNLYVPGNVIFPSGKGEAFAEVQITPSSTLTDITVAVGDTSITLSGISVGEKETLTIGYDDRMNLMIKKGSKSYLANRTAVSSDDLRAVCGSNNQVSITASAAVSATFQARGVWL